MHVWSIRLPLVLAFLLAALPALLLPGAAPAQMVSPPSQEAAAPAPDRAQLESLLETLEDDQARALLVAQLRALLELHADTDADRAQVGTRLMQLLSDRIELVSREVIGAANLLQNLPALADWAIGEVAEPDRRNRILDVLWKIVLVLGAGWLAQRLFLTLLARPRQALEAKVPNGLAGRFAVGASLALLEIVPIAAFAAAAYLVLPLTEPREVTRLVALAKIGRAHV